jgi:hypothetical protein
MGGRVMKDVFYVRGLVCETRKTTVMVVAADEEEATLKAAECGVTHVIEVRLREDYEGLPEGDNFIIGFKQS